MAEARSGGGSPARADKGLRVLVVADVRLYREGLANTLGGRKGMTVVGAAGDRNEALKLLPSKQPHIVVLDMATPNSLELVRAISASAPLVRIIAFAIEGLDREILNCAEAGVAGYVPCEASIDDLVAMIESVSRGELLCPPRTVSMLFRHLATLAKGDDEQLGGANITGRELGRLNITAREREIVVLIDEGLSNKEIAQRLRIEVATVKNHVHNILDKLHVTTRAEAAARLRRRPTRSSRSELSEGK